VHAYQHRYVVQANLGHRKAFLEEMRQLTQSGLPCWAKWETGSIRHSSSPDSVFATLPIPKEGDCKKASSLLFLSSLFFFFPRLFKEIHLKRLDFKA